MPLLARPSNVEKFFARTVATAHLGRTAVDRPDLSQIVLTHSRTRWHGELTVGPLNSSEDAETCLAWLRRWVDDPAIWTEIPLYDVTAGDVPANREISSVSSSGVITANGAHGLAKGDGVRFYSVFAIVVTVPSSTTFRIYPTELTDNLAGGDAIVGSQDILARAVQPAEIPEQFERGLRQAVRFPWIER